MPMSIDNIFGIGGTALHAQITRLNTTASNLANAGTTAATEKEIQLKKTADKIAAELKPILADVSVDLEADGTYYISAKSADGNSIGMVLHQDDAGNPVVKVKHIEAAKKRRGAGSSMLEAIHRAGARISHNLDASEGWWPHMRRSRPYLFGDQSRKGSPEQIQMASRHAKDLGGEGLGRSRCTTRIGRT